MAKKLLPKTESMMANNRVTPSDQCQSSTMQLVMLRRLTGVKTTVQYSTFLRGPGETGCGFPILDILLLRLSSLLLNPAIEIIRSSQQHSIWSHSSRSSRSGLGIKESHRSDSTSGSFCFKKKKKKIDHQKILFQSFVH